jgi:hypothetical protein
MVSIEVDSSGEAPVGKRCRLLRPYEPRSCFNTRDLEELLALLAESPSSTSIVNILALARFGVCSQCALVDLRSWLGRHLRDADE